MFSYFDAKKKHKVDTAVQLRGTNQEVSSILYFNCYLIFNFFKQSLLQLNLLCFDIIHSNLFFGKISDKPFISPNRLDGDTLIILENIFIMEKILRQG